MADHLNHLHPVHKATNKPEQTAEVLKFFDWAYKTAGKKRMRWITRRCRKAW
ncbi:hypothetical protein [Klebsiella pneumoniae]|uniref:hypothetical protein n=1 Tax=Klebsiella pneumoniae TaxID=573 RepID=UPI000F1A7BD6|nr:Phosphate-binding protein PstS [Klebsiella pneumoniae]